ncbi:sensor domain-containing diguanylate cyclase [Pantoea graminicola]|uniref:GGDEF domain-containing protein n=1 Tax=unclassified Pantoea TaxID=2630326 RepID=UPI000DA6F1AD|nr:GGDEF domain-containing protein [Pantoea sp. ARC607]PZL91775.1 sensor domain-containing diguanylate cyclase [Pantoea sp. ARC607]
MRIELFEEHNAKKNAFSLFLITLLFCFIGGHLRFPQELSLFWPVNAIITGIIVRHPFLHQTRYYLASFAAMVFNDTVFSGWALTAFTLNLANLLFVLVAVLLLVKHLQHNSGSERITSVLRIFPACLLAALACASWGALAQQADFDTGLATAWGEWFSEQFSTGLMLLPFLLTRDWSSLSPRQFRELRKLFPVIAVVLSLIIGAMMGGAGSLTFPVPALVWCAVVLPMPLTSLVILLTGITEIILVSHGLMNIQGDDNLLPVSHLTSARLGVATIAISPLIVAASMDAIRQLNERLALRANYDFLTRLLSRSGLYESLHAEPINPARTAGVILIDVDYFKTINDNFGHDAGDSVLEEIARRMQRVVGKAGRICRFGGEEFVVILFDQNPDKLYFLAEAIRQKMAKEKFWLQGSKVTVTISLGLAHGRAGRAAEWHRVINRLISAADKNLYLSKRNGRNQTSPVGEQAMTSDVA